MRAATRIVLGSKSPRRRAILRDLGLEFAVLESGAPETDSSEDPVATVTENALRKHVAVRPACPDAVLITADTTVWFETRSLGKPRTPADAAAMLRAFSGKSQLVFSAVALSRPGETPDVRVAASSVQFRPITEADIAEYLETVCPMDRAGAYDIAENGDRIVAGYAGSYTNIMGLPREVVEDWLLARLPPDSIPWRRHAG